MATETQAIRENYELGVLAGEAREQQRIIKLLEEEFLAPDFDGDSITEADNCLVNLGMAIALIKGEK